MVVVVVTVVPPGWRRVRDLPMPRTILIVQRKDTVGLVM